MSQLPFDWFEPDWPAPNNVRACVTTRSVGDSLAPYAHFNVGEHVGDERLQVQRNRQFLAEALGCQPSWLNQVHGNLVVDADASLTRTADASVSREVALASCIMSADCLPVLFADQAGSCVAAAHAGWRSLVAGILENTVARMQVAPWQIMAWLGPAIGPKVFEVGEEVREAFVHLHAEAEHAFVPSQSSERWLADIYQLARVRLAACGVQAIYGGGLCTVTDPRFYSYRRDARTGRFASLVWLTR
ncbi:peptidoglycan editing factor PgeF [Denitrificimonas sp. JX-1]|uniref:Purine nucleoside phosphorylase n=1 Tax=Denitrificimonas halotolerans TaxID=3098930 RepID=A0ABU5GN59_9GAMM|nr:peptidoglycan editing factor PgeF [Denitrificimonas sp. JX-1]MDY7218279.1 peptidoglycan editing factor PgeF [Denitrificimonas sp. JX-1]